MNRIRRAGCALALRLCAQATWAAETPFPKDRIVVENTTDVSSLHTVSADLTLLWSPLGAFYESGPRVRITGAISRYKFWGDPEMTFLSSGQDTELDVLLGYGFKLERGLLLTAVGPTVVRSAQWPGDLSPPSAVVRHGVKAYSSLYANPTDATMLYSQAYYSSVGQSYYFQGKGGWAVLPRVFVGPEVTFSGGTGRDQWRLGGHISGLKLGPLLLGLSAGYENDRTQGRGAYGGTSLQMFF